MRSFFVIIDLYLKSFERFSLTLAVEILLVSKVLIVKASILYRDYFLCMEPMALSMGNKTLPIATFYLF